MVMEFVDGETLANRLETGPAAARQALRYAMGDRRRARQGARAGRRASRSEARERHDHDDGCAGDADVQRRSAARAVPGTIRKDRLGERDYDVSPDGSQFLVIATPEDQARAELNVVINWFEELRKK